MRRALLVGASVVGVSLSAAQQFRSTTSLLTLDVSVLDPDGNPVSGLNPEDFVVTLNNAVRPVRAMVFLATRETRTAASVATTPAAATLPGRVNETPSETEPDPRLMVILVDDLSVYPTDSK